MMTAANEDTFGVLLDIDGVLYVGDEPIEDAHEALSALREQSAGGRLVTNTTSRSRRESSSTCASWASRSPMRRCSRRRRWR